jgi:eukaryotic-like serine/threonine-protein kinase
LSDSPAAIAPLRAIEDEEHAARVIRVRKSLSLGAAVWPSFAVFDWMIVTWVHPGRLSTLLVLRAVFWVFCLGSVLVRLYRKPTPTPRVLAAIEIIGFTGAVIVSTVMGVETGGLASIYNAGFSVILIYRGMSIFDHWKRGLIENGIPILAHVATLIVAAAAGRIPPEQLHDSRTIVTFLCYLALDLASYLSIVFGGHAVWAMRRQVFEARNLGRYRLKTRIGVGAMGEVWAAYHPTLKRQVALKVLRPDSAHDEYAIARFEREVRATTELTHPHTVRVFDYGTTDDGVWYYAMELLEGETLGAMVERAGPLPAARAIHFATQAARALAEAHGLGIVHRDVKPDNLFVTTAGGERDFIKVLDFGVAKLAAVPETGELTVEGRLIGTPAYVSPEVAMGQSADVRSDVYSLGAVVYYLVTGTQPFPAANVAAQLTAQINQEPEAPSARLGKPIPADVEGVILRCLAKDPAARYDSASLLVQALAACADFGAWEPGTPQARAGGETAVGP